MILWIIIALLVTTVVILTVWFIRIGSRSPTNDESTSYRVADQRLPGEPKVDTPTASVPSDRLVSRLPILNGKQQIVAYELLIPSSFGSDKPPSVTEIATVARELLDALQGLGTKHGEKLKIFLSIHPDMLRSKYLELVSFQLVVEIPEHAAENPKLLEHCRALRSQGYQFYVDATDDRQNLDLLLECADYVRLDAGKLMNEELRLRVTQLRERKIPLIASGVDSIERFVACRSKFMDYYQGYYFAHAQPPSTRRFEPFERQVSLVFNLLLRHAEIEKIEDAIKQDVALSYKLLRYINSAYFGLVSEVKSIRHALTILGYDKLLRWVAIYMLTQRRRADDANPAREAIYITALQRARTMELLAAERLDEGQQELLFLVGMFSLLNLLLGVPLAEVLDELNLPDDAVRALLYDEGPYAAYLRLAIALENMNPPRTKELMDELGFSILEVNKAQFEAMDWVARITQADDDEAT